jgi:hypothetical protein
VPTASDVAEKAVLRNQSVSQPPKARASSVRPMCLVPNGTLHAWKSTFAFGLFFRVKMSQCLRVSACQIVWLNVISVQKRERKKKFFVVVIIVHLG